VRVMTVEDAARELRLSHGDHGRVLVLLRTPERALELLDHGVPFLSLNVGGMAAALGTTRLFRSVSATPEQVAALAAIQRRGLKVYLQMVPEERPIDISELLPAAEPAPREGVCQPSKS